MEPPLYWDDSIIRVSIMANPIFINYDKLSSEKTDIKMLQSKMKMSVFRNKLHDNIKNSIKESFNIDDPYENLTINGENVIESIGKILDLEIMHPQDLEQICAILVTKAHLEGKPVQIKNSETQEIIDLTPTGTMPSTVKRDKITFLDQILMFFGIIDREERMAEFEENEAKFKSGQKDLVWNLNYYANENAQNYQDNIIKLENEKIKLYSDYKKDVLDKYHTISDMYFPEKGLDGTMKKYPNHANYTFRSTDNMLTLMMLNKGHTLKEIADPNFTTDRVETGKELEELVVSILNKDPEISAQGQKNLRIYM